MSYPQEFTDLHGNRIVFGAASHNDETDSFPCIEASKLGLFEATCVFWKVLHFIIFDSFRVSSSFSSVRGGGGRRIGKAREDIQWEIG
jgi:hypothetical protein